ncbi:MAG: hypothetical protein HQL38_12230, partial [Alphaproteobacteria bacterium]|nr:hypothetical protein [Alphaproteobacteria bacterium]
MAGSSPAMTEKGTKVNLLVPYEFVVRRVCEIENVSYEIDEEDLIGDGEVDDVEDAE